ncbi:hypothetical protein MASR2M48_29330 [Spirochaetota bacterium]
MSFTKKMFSKKFFLVNLVLVGIMIGFIAAFAILAKAPGSDGSAIAHAESAPQSASRCKRLCTAGKGHSVGV